MTIGDRALVLVSPVEVGSVARVLRQGPDERRGDPAAEGIVSLDLRAGRLPPHLERRFPSIGAIIAGALAVLVALVSNGFTAALIVLGIVLLVQQVEGNVLQPIIQGRGFNLHAAVVILAVTAGSSLAGIIGAFLGAIAGAFLIALAANGFEIPGRNDTELVQAAIALPGAMVGIGLVYLEGVRRGNEPVRL